MTEHGKDASQRAELKERIIATATEAFTTKGIKSITMDDIAAALGISKRTLYEVFVNKESLLKDCILTVQAERDRYLQEVYEQSHNVLEVILAVFQKSIEMFHKTNKRFFEDIKKYPKVYNMMKERSESDSEKTMSFFYVGSGARHFPFGCQLCNRQFAGTRAVRCAVEYGCMQRIFLYRGV